MNAALDGNFALDLARVTEIAAICAARWLGRGDGPSGLDAAASAMRRSFLALDVAGVVRSGGAEGDAPPVFIPGERLGAARGPAVDLALDPVEGLELLACGRPNALSVAGAAPAGGLLAPGPSSYMFKLVTREEARGALDLDAPVAENLRRVARALGKDLERLTVFLLDKPRHQELVAQVRAAGARILLHPEGDVAGALMVASPKPAADVLLGTGGTAEGVLTACALRGMGGAMLARLAPQSDAERQAVLDAGMDLKQVYTERDLVSAEDAFFACTGISTGDVLQGVRYDSLGAATHSLTARAQTGAVRYIHSRHNRQKLRKLSGLEHL